MAEEGGLGLPKLTLGGVNGETMEPKKVQNLAEVEVKTLVRRGDEYVIQVAKYERQHTVHHLLEGSSSIAQPKRHNNKLVHAKRSNHGSLGDVRWVYRNLIVSFYQINLRKNVSTSQPVGEISNVGDRVLVRNSSIVEPPKIAARTPRTVRLGHHM